MTPEYKAEKEASVSFLGGGGIWEINHVTLVAPVRTRCFPRSQNITANIACRPPLSSGQYSRNDKVSSSHTRSRRPSRIFCSIAAAFCSRSPSMLAHPKSSMASSFFRLSRLCSNRLQSPTPLQALRSRPRRMASPLSPRMRIPRRTSIHCLSSLLSPPIVAL